MWIHGCSYGNTPFADVKVGTKTPNWNAIKASDMMKPVQDYSRKISDGPGSYVLAQFHYKYIRDFNVTVWQGWIEGQYHMNYVRPPISESDIRSRANDIKLDCIAEADALLQRRLANMSVESLVEGMELHKTLAMFGSRVQKLSEFATKLSFKSISKIKMSSYFKQRAKSHRAGIRYVPTKKGLQLSAVSRKTLISDYLEWTYGWGPLAGAVEDAAKALAKVLVGQRKKKISAHAFRTLTTSNRVISFGSAVYGPYYEVWITEKIRIDIWSGCLLKNEWDTAQIITDAFGISGYGVVRSAFDLTYFSFLADYVSNLGDVVSNFGLSLTRMMIGSSYRSEKITYESSYEIRNFKGSSQDAYQRPSFEVPSIIHQGFGKQMFFSRARTTPIDHYVRLHFQTPNLRQVFNTTALALGFSFKGFRR
jgi:hypothetical protein